MSNKSKQKGTKAETNVVKFLEGNGIKAERKALHGSNDLGDVHVSGNIEMILEVKAGKQTENPNRTQIEEWMRQARTEGDNAELPVALVVVRYRRAIKDANVYYYDKVADYWVFMYLDEFIDKLK